MTPTKPARPIAIPRDLKRGDVIITADKNQHEFGCYDNDGDAVCSDGATYHLNGRRYKEYGPPAVRIIRKTSKPARGDRDAVFRKRAAEFITALADTYSEKDHYRNKPVRKTLRAIARRLSGEGT